MDGTLPRMEPDRTQVFNGVNVSYGIAPILSAFSDLSTQHNRPSWSLYLFNVETIIRDRKEDKTSIDDIARAVITDCNVLAQYVAAYNRLAVRGIQKDKPIICFYLPAYERLPKVYLRDKLPKGTEDRWVVRRRIEEILQKEGWQDHYDETEVLFSMPDEKYKWPHKGVLADLIHFRSGIQFRKALMISHVPLDFHLYKAFQDFTILESYTGAFKQQRQLGQKVFKMEDVRFCKYTHLLLGDKWYLRSFITPKQKKELKEIAAHDHWNLIPEKNILEALIRLKYVPSDILIKPDI